LGPAALALTMGFARLGGQGLRAGKPFTLLRVGAVIASLGALVVARHRVAGTGLSGILRDGDRGFGSGADGVFAGGQMSAPEARARAVARATLLGYFGYFFGPPLLG
jgi:hypothetical protein